MDSCDKIVIFGQTVQVPPNRVAYNAIRMDFIRMANEAAVQYEKLYKQDGSIQKVINGLGEQMHDCLAPTLDHCITTLIHHGVIDIDVQTFAERYQSFAEPCAEAFNDVYDRYAEVVMDEEELNEYRKARREGRARWQGGGFGLAGALSGAVTAGALNLVMGAGHMVFNAIGRTFSSIATSFKLSKIYDDPNTCKTLLKGLRLSVFNLHFALVCCLDELDIDHVPASGLVTPEEHRQGEAILSNVDKLPTEDDKQAALLRVFDLDPYQARWYSYVLQHYGDQDGQLSNTAHYFGVLTVDEEKRSLLAKFAESFTIDTEQQALAAQEKIDAYRKKLAYFEPLLETQTVLQAVKRFDEEYRTVDGIVCSTREAADQARKESADVRRILRTADGGNLLALKQAEAALAEYHSPIAVNAQNEICKRRQAAELAARTVEPRLTGVEPIICDNADEAESLRGYDNILYARLKQCGDGIEAETALVALKNDIKRIGYPSQIQDIYLAEINQLLAGIDRVKRTVFGTEYPTQERAAAAKAAYDTLREQVAAPEAKNAAEDLRNAIAQSDLPDAQQEELRDTLFENENEKELKAAKKLSVISGVIVLIIVACTIAFGLKFTPALASKTVPFLGQNLVMTTQEVSNDLGYVDGLRNGVLIFGHAIVEIFVGAFYEYIGGFDYGIVGNIIWAFLGLFWVLLKYMLFAIAQYCVTLVLAFFQKATLGYYVGYLISVPIPFAVSRFNFDEDEREENVARIKELRPGKIAKWVLLSLLAIGISIAFIWMESNGYAIKW